MQRTEITDLVLDTLERRFESYAQSQIKLHTEYHEKLLSAVDQKLDSTIDKSIGKYVNGKIDKIQKTLDERLKPFESTRNWFVQFKDGATWVAGFITPLVIVGGAILWFINEVKR